MSDVDAWIYFDGPEPDHVRDFLDALRDPLPVAPEEDEGVLRTLLERLEAKLPPLDETLDAGDAPPLESAPPPAVRCPPAALLLDDAEVESAPPTPGAPALQKEEKAPEPPHRAGRPPAFLAETANSFGAAPRLQPALSASGVRPAPTVQVVGAAEHPRTLELPVMDPSQGARPALPALSLEGYVAYLVELEVWPEKGAEIHERYGIKNVEAYWEVVRYWEGQIAASPQARAQADAMRATYWEKARAMERERSGGR